MQFDDEKTQDVFSANCIMQKLKYQIHQYILVQRAWLKYHRADNINRMLKCKLQENN